VLAAGLPCDEEIASPALLEGSLARLESGLLASGDPVLVVVADDDAAGFARLALARGAPVLTWPLRQATPRRARPLRSAPRARLTGREREILARVAAGASNKAIARALRISPNTVKFHMATLFDKLAVTTRAEAIAAAARSGELSL